MICSMKLKVRKGEKLNVLVVDDEADIRETLASFLEMMELFTHIVEAKDGSDASLRLKNQQFDFVITDLIMPKVKGIELIERVKREDKAARKEHPTPILILSGNITSEEVQKALHYGVKYVLTKPCTAENFINKVNHILSRELRHKVKVLKEDEQD